MTPKIIDRGRGPEIEGTRVTVYTVWEYAQHGDHHTYIAAMLDISSAEVLCALEYIEDHKEQVLKDYAEIMERINRGNPPEVKALLRESHKKLMVIKRKLLAKQQRRAKNAGLARRR